MKLASYLGGLLGLALFVALVVHADWSAMERSLVSAGWPLLWLIPYRASFYLLYAAGWLILLAPENLPRRARLGYTVWVAAVREAIDRLLPVASLGGGVIGVRLMRWRGLDAISLGASVVVEIMLTLVASYLFTAMGLLLLSELSAGEAYRRLPLFFLLSIPVPVVSLLLLRYGAVFEKIQKLLAPLVGMSVSAEAAMRLDRALRLSLSRRRELALVTAIHCAALASGAFEVWFALRLFGHPIGAAAAIVLESMTLAVRHVAFFVPAGIGVQEAGLVLFGHALGIDSELALAVSMAKRVRELAWGIPALISWQWLEGRRLNRDTAVHSFD